MKKLFVVLFLSVLSIGVCCAGETLTTHKNTEVEKHIHELKYGRTPLFRFNAAEALGDIGDTSAIPALIEALKNGENLVKRPAAAALGKIGKPAVPALIETLKDKRVRVRGNVVYALGKIGDKSTIEVLTSIAQNDSDKGVREEAQKAIKKIKERN